MKQQIYNTALYLRSVSYTHLGMVALTQPCIKLRIQLLQALRWRKSNLVQECLQSLVEPLVLAFALRISGLRIQ